MTSWGWASSPSERARSSSKGESSPRRASWRAVSEMAVSRWRASSASRWAVRLVVDADLTPVAGGVLAFLGFVGLKAEQRLVDQAGDVGDAAVAGARDR